MKVVSEVLLVLNGTFVYFALTFKKIAAVFCERYIVLSSIALKTGKAIVFRRGRSPRGFQGREGIAGFFVGITGFSEGGEGLRCLSF